MTRITKSWSGILVVCASMAACSIATVHAAELFTPEHVAKLRSVGSAEISPNGHMVAYTVSVPRQPFEDKDGSAWSELHVTDLSGASRPYITGEGSVGSIHWTPDGMGISFLAKRGKDKNRSLYVIPIDGGEARNVLSHKTAIGSYDWSPDGSRVAFLATDKKDKRIKKLADKGFGQEVYEEDLRYTRVWIGTPDDDDAESRMLELEGSASELHWSPDGKRLVVALAPTPLIDDRYMKRKVYVVDAENGKTLARFDNPGKLGQVAWSPDGKRLAMISAEDLHDPSAGRLMVASASGGALKDILPNYMGQVGGIAWQDKGTIMFLGAEGVWTTLQEIRFDGTARKTHLAGGKAVMSGLRLSKDGQIGVVRGQSDRHPSEVYVMAHGETDPKRLTDSNPWLADMRFAKQEVVSHNARDGLRLEGILYRPLDEQPGKRYPLILAVHGGPESHRSNGWLTSYSGPGQVAAAKGYAVFYPNYRGSTGRGVAFSKMGQGDYAGGEFDDLVDAVDHLIATGLVDRDKVGVTGGSYGGFATAWCSTYHSERFAAGVMFVGISDHLSKSGTTDIPNEMVLVHATMHPWDNWELFLKRSPIYHVQKARTPLIILGGKDDTRVHPSQSLELYRHLKVLGKAPVRLVRYPGEGHGNRKAGARYDYNLRMIRWFDHYLKGSGGDPPPHQLDYPLEEDDDDDDDEEDDDD